LKPEANVYPMSALQDHQAGGCHDSQEEDVSATRTPPGADAVSQQDEAQQQQANRVRLVVPK